MDLVTVVNSVFCLVAFAALVCMLQTCFRASGRVFRWSAKALAGGLLVSAFAPLLFDQLDVALTELLVNGSLAMVLALMRLRQVHPVWYDQLEAAGRRLSEKLREFTDRHRRA